MEAAVYQDDDVLSAIFAVVWGVGVGGVCDYDECADLVWGVAGDCSADIPAVFLGEFDEDERDVPQWNLLEGAGVGVAAGGVESSVGRFASAVDAGETFGVW